MAIVVEEQIEVGAESGVALVLPSWTPAADELILVGVSQRNAVSVSSVIGNTITHTQVDSVVCDQDIAQQDVWRGMSGSPVTGSITVTRAADNGSWLAFAIRISGVDTGGTNGSGAAEASNGATNPPATDDANMKADVTTITDNALAMAFGCARLSSLTVPAGETAIRLNFAAGSGGSNITASIWRETALVSPPATVTLGADGDLSTAREWGEIALSIKPASAGGTVDLAATLSTSATLTADLSVIVGLSSVIASSAVIPGLVTPLGRIRTFISAATTDITVSADIKALKTLASDISSSIVVTSDVQRTLGLTSALASGAVVSTSVSLTLGLAGAIVSSGTVVASITRPRALASDLSIDVTVDSTVSKSRQLDAALTTSVSVATSLQLNVGLAAATTCSITAIGTLATGAVEDLAVAFTTSASAAAALTVKGLSTSNIIPCEDPMLTYRDAIDNLIDGADGGSQTRDARVYKRSVRDGFRLFSDFADWKYYETPHSINVDGSSYEGRLQYTNSDRQLTNKFAVTALVNTTPINITIDPDFAAQDGETIFIADNATVIGSFVISETGTNQFNLVGSTTGPAYTGGATVRRVAHNLPSWFGNASVLIGNTYFKVKRRLTDFVATMADSHNPGRDIPGQVMSAEIHDVALPCDFRAMSWVVDSDLSSFSDHYVRPEQWLAIEQTRYFTDNYPFSWTILADLNVPGQKRLHYRGRPIDNRTISFIYVKRKNNAFRWSGHESEADSGISSSSVNVTAGSTLVAGTGTAFRSSMTGAILRLGRAGDTESVTGLDGINPYEEEHIIESVTDATNLVLRTEVKTTASAASYMITDLVDVPTEYFNAFYRACEYQYANLSKDPSRQSAAYAAFVAAAKIARANDWYVTFYRGAEAEQRQLSIFGDPRRAQIGDYVDIGTQ
jgi:hypothetical protein